MKNNLISLIIAIFGVMFLFSCEKYSADEYSKDGSANSVLKIYTRTASVEGSLTEMKISYPVNIYVFNKENKCVALTNITSGEEDISLKLLAGEYDVYAIAGADEENYNLPAMENATKETVISLKEGAEHSDLMTAEGHVTLVDNGENSLTLTLERKVMLLETVTITDVPKEVTAVMVTISPLYENLMINGNYSGEKGTYTVNLGKGADGTTWTAICDKYLFGAVGQAVIKVSLVDTKIRSFSYICTDNLVANHKIDIRGNYNEPELTLTGIINGAIWEDSKEISFEFGGSSVVDDNEGEEDDDDNIVDDDNGPVSVGDIYGNDFIVVRCQSTGNQSVVTLMSLKELDKLIYDEDDQTSVRTAVYAGLAELATDGLPCRLATMEEIAYVADNADVLNVFLRDKGLNNIMANGRYSYYFKGESDAVLCYNLGSHNVATPKSESASYILRAFATVTLDINN